MNQNPEFIINDEWIVASRGKKNTVDWRKPYGWQVEKERTISGKIEDTGIIFLTNRECTFRCLMCDLWKNTTDETVPLGAIPDQIEWVLGQMPAVKHLKLYNSGSFFDRRAVPVEDYQRIASLLDGFETVIVESHSKYIGKSCLDFKEMLQAELHVSIGLETVHPEILQRLNKKMTLGEFENSVSFLTKNEIISRAFILLRPPFLSEAEGIYWAQKSIEFAFQSGVECCVVIPTRSGNGALDLLKERGDFNLPVIQSLEMVLEYGINLNAGRIFADTWDLGLFSECEKCLDLRTKRINAMNLNQKVLEQIVCSCSSFDNQSS